MLIDGGNDRCASDVIERRRRDAAVAEQTIEDGVRRVDAARITALDRVLDPRFQQLLPRPL